MGERTMAPQRGLARLRVALVILASAAVVIGLAPAASAATYDPNPVGPSWVPPSGAHAVLPDDSRGLVYVGGAFGVVALTAGTGELVWNGNANGDVRALALTGDGRLLLGGAFSSVGGTTHRKLAAVNAASGAVDNTFKPAAGGTVRDIVVVNGIAYFGGQFTNQNGITQGGLGAVDLTGKVVPAFNATTNGQVYALGTDGTRLFIGGKFTTVNGQTRTQLASVTLSNNSLDAWAPKPGCGACNVVWDLTVDNARNRVYTVGRNGGTGYTVDKSTGAKLFGVTGGVNGDSQAVALGADGRTLYIGGHFTAISGQPIMLVAAFDVSGNKAVIDPTFSARFVTSYPGVWALASTGSRLYVAGDFTAAGQKVNGKNVHPYFAIFATPGSGGGDTTAPTATVSPADGATDVPVTTAVTATFSEPVQGVDGTQFTLSSGATQVPANVALDASGTVATLTPGAPLANSTTYTANLANTIKDAANNAYAGLTWTFTTVAGSGGGTGDTTPPTVTNRSPNDGATGVGTSVNATVTFSELMQGVDKNTFTLVNQSSGATVLAVVTQNSNNPQKWVLNPNNPLQSGTTYQARVRGGPGGVTDQAGNQLAFDEVWSFTTAGTGDTTPPTVGNKSPNDGATGVSASVNATATFSELVKNVTTDTFTLVDLAGGTTVTATVTQNSNIPQKWVLNPTSNLQSGHTYQATVVGGTGGVTDLAGNPLAANVTWTFTVA